MAFLREGFTITYVGDDSDGLTLGDKGQLIAFANASAEPDDLAHCMWHTGLRTGDVTMTRIGDIDNASAKYQRQYRDDLADSLDVGHVQITGARQVMASAGVDGVLVYLSTEGALTALADHARSAMRHLASCIRADREIMVKLADLDVDQQEEVIAQAALRGVQNITGE